MNSNEAALLSVVLAFIVQEMMSGSTTVHFIIFAVTADLIILNLSCTASYVSETLLIFVNLVDFAFLLKLLAQEK